MDECVNEFNAITDELGRVKQAQAYGAHLGMYSRPAGGMACVRIW